MKIRDKVILLGGVDKIKALIKEGKNPKETSELMGYKSYNGFKQALRRIYGTNFSAIYKEVIGKEYKRNQQQIPISTLKKYVDCGLSVNSISDLLGFGKKNITEAFKREYSLTIREYKTKYGI